jgi:HAMP domain-containing protein
MSLARGAALAANELRRADTSVIARSRQALDSMSVSARVTQSAVQERQLQQQGAAPQRQAFDQARVGAAPPALPLAAPRIADSIRQGRIVTTGVGAVATDAVISPIGCYELRFILDASGRIAAVSDTVRLLDDLVQRDDGWRLAQRVGGSRLAATAWRQVDSVTVELRTGVARDSSSVRFLWRGATVWQGGGQVLVRGAPDTTGLSGRRAALALRTVCP